MAIDFRSAEYLTFDCYGTLIDWETGIVKALLPILRRHDRVVGRRNLLELFASFEAPIQREKYLTYREVLRRVVDRLGDSLHFAPSEADRIEFSGSVGEWPAFRDSRMALRELATRFRLVVVSNVDDDLFALSDRRLGSPFHHVFTAQQIGSYKPNLRNFQFVIERLGGDSSSIVHVAQSLFHDIRPAMELGLRTVWINRRAGREGAGATPPAVATPDLELPSMAALVEYAVGAKQSED